MAFDSGIRIIKRMGVSFRSFDDAGEVAEIVLKSIKKGPPKGIKRAILLGLYKRKYSWMRQFFEANKDSIALCWNGLKGNRRLFVEAAGRAGTKIIFFELSPLPGRVSIDPSGVNYGNSLPRCSRYYMDWRLNNDQFKNQWKLIRGDIVSRAEVVNKNVSQIDKGVPEDQRPYLFAPLQVQGDSQIRCYGGPVQSVAHFVRILDEYSRCLPPNWTIRIKEHPSSRVPYKLRESISHNSRLIVDNETDTIRLIKDSSGVVTINSSVGLESLFFEKPVLVLGRAFYGFEGVSNSISDLNEIGSIFSDPVHKMKFDREVVGAFLDYICCVHFPRISTLKDGSICIDDAWLTRFKAENLGEFQH